MGFPIRKLCGRAALITLMLVGGMLAASMSYADDDDGAQTAGPQTLAFPSAVAATPNSTGRTHRPLAD